MQFLLEAIIISLIGCLVGVFGGVGAAMLANALAGIPVVITMTSIVLAFAVAASGGTASERGSRGTSGLPVQVGDVPRGTRPMPFAQKKARLRKPGPRGGNPPREEINAKYARLASGLQGRCNGFFAGVDGGTI